MKNRILIGLIATSMLSTAAQAREGSFYIGADGGLMQAETSDVYLDSAGLAGEIDWDVGYDFDMIAGYDFGGFRLETEAAYKGANDDGGMTRNGEFEDDEAAIDFTTLSFMVNGIVEFGRDEGLQGFLGGGAGVARTKMRMPGDTVYFSDSDTGFAWQLIAGFRAPLSDNWDAGFKYRYFRHDGIEMSDAGAFDDGYEVDLRTHSLMGSIIYNFWSPEPAPIPPPPPPPPPPPAPQVVCNTGPYIVFFDWDSSDITSEAAGILDSAVASYADCDSVPIMVAGHTDRSGPSGYNVRLSEKRAKAVSDYLIARNIPAGEIATQGFGENQLRVETADGVREPQNRRVEIIYGSGSGL
ncbi:OmpA family protein [Croceicoccus sp. Ery15]|uniref:OmpA family protein n=1 Tax=Croceicoccus sp. Ery15 TaxID=1703338 RepID=UPI00351D223A